MIHSITANQASFSPVIFTSGLNIILGELSAKSAPKDTRNGLGKSTIIEIINFCLGGSSSEKLPEESLKQWIFTIDLTINGNRIKATRAIAAPDKINIEGNTNNCLIKPNKDLLEEYYTINQWNQVLGDALFGIPTTEEKNVPTFRGLIQYFLRRTHDAYSEPFSYFRNQPAWQKQLYISFLLGFDWHLAQKQQALTDRKKILDNMKSALKAGVINFSGSLGELEAEQIIIQQKVDRINNQLSTFQVHSEYEYIRKEADKITTKLQKLNNINVTDSIKLSRYEEALCQEDPPVDILLEEIYKEVGIAFENNLKRSLLEARAFHSQIIKNRKDFLQDEVDILKLVIKERIATVEQLSNKRAELLRILSTHGALEEFTALQTNSNDLRDKLGALKKEISNLRQIDKEGRDIKSGKSKLEKSTIKDYDNKRKVWTEAIKIFGENSQALYNNPGNLIINTTKNGFKFNVSIARSSSTGIGKMKIFCFDLMILMLNKEFNNGLDIDFLIHDSIIFDGVDSRQRALALEKIVSVSKASEIQYICTLNSDEIPNADFSKDFDIDKFICTKIPDDKCLLGVQF